MGWTGLRLSVTLLTVIPLRSPSASRSSDSSGSSFPAVSPDRAAAGAAMAWAPAVGLLLGAAGAAVLLGADHPLGAGPLTGAVLAVSCGCVPGNA